MKENASDSVYCWCLKHMYCKIQMRLHDALKMKHTPAGVNLSTNGWSSDKSGEVYRDHRYLRTIALKDIFRSASTKKDNSRTATIILIFYSTFDDGWSEINTPILQNVSSFGTNACALETIGQNSIEFGNSVMGITQCSQSHRVTVYTSEMGRQCVWRHVPPGSSPTRYLR